MKFTTEEQKKMGPNTDRFKDLTWAKVAHKKNIMLGGLGGIGSWTALFLSRAGFNIYGFDFDSVEVHNLGGQLYSAHDIGSSKASSLTTILDNLVPGHRFQGLNIMLEFTGSENPIISPYVIVGFDNMKSRKEMFVAWHKKVTEGEYSDNSQAFFIDGRMRAEGFQLYFVRNNNEDFKKYDDTLFNDKDVPDEVCTIKATSHVGAMVSTFIVAAIANHFSDQEIDPRVNPFETIIDLELFNFNTK